MPYSLLLIFALSPSIIWLLFFLRKDAHPELNREIIKIFFYGMLAALPAVLIELGISEGFIKARLFFSQYFIFPAWLYILNMAIGLSFVEEFLKYLVVREKVLNNPEFDEPTDAILYMIIAALGFAAFENILIFFSPESIFITKEAFSLSVFRFVGATFLHALCSGLVGYFLALSLFEIKKRWWLIFLGLVIATLLHGLFNFSIINIGASTTVRDGLTAITNPGLFISSIIILITILIGSTIFVLLGLKRLKKLASVCLPDLPSATQRRAGKIK